jgi:hypothetical protein
MGLLFYHACVLKLKDKSVIHCVQEGKKTKGHNEKHLHFWVALFSHLDTNLIIQNQNGDLSKSSKVGGKYTRSEDIFRVRGYI